MTLGCGRVSFDPLSGASSDARSDGTGGTSDPDGGGDLGDALTSTGPCPTPTVIDSFDDGVLDQTWTPIFDPDIDLTESGSHLVFSFAANASSNATTLIASPFMDFTDRCVTIVVAKVRAVNNAETNFEVGTGSARMRISVLGTTLIANDQPPTTVPPTYPYDAVLDAQWQIRIRGGRVVALTLDSAGNPHRLLRDLPSFFDEASARITLSSGVTSGNVNGGSSELDAIAY